MLSILIPEYNYNCVKLVSDLTLQCTKASVTYEIIVLDDASTNDKAVNRRISEISGCLFVESEQNEGLAKTRNKLVKMARYQYLLIIDCDAEVNDNAFIQRYIGTIGQAQVVAGGIGYSLNKPESNRCLRWFYGKKRECLSAKIRNQNPYKSSLSFNLMVEKDVLLKYPYDESFTDYGHEDSVMGYTLKKAGISILHIDNYLTHNGLDLNEVFLAKSLKAVEKQVTNPAFQTDEMTDQIRIFKIYRKIKNFGLRRLLAFKFKYGKSLMMRNLCSRHPSLLLFDFYRLSYLCLFSIDYQKQGSNKAL